jgi:Glucosamine-6-phosphate isomerases/6-phosphogluconolactonase
MTLAYPALARAEEILWLVTGASKHDALARLLADDQSIPAARVQARRSVILADAPAVHGPPPTFQEVIFDVDGVLVDSPHYRAWRKALQELMDTEWADLRPQPEPVLYLHQGMDEPAWVRRAPGRKGHPRKSCEHDLRRR